VQRIGLPPSNKAVRRMNTIALCSDIGPVLIPSSGVSEWSVPKPPALRSMETSQRWSNFIDYRFSFLS
jgi:hypothetical protein